MKRVLLTLVLSATAFIANAQTYQWVQVSHESFPGGTVLKSAIDIANIKTENNFKYYWFRFDQENLFNKDGTRFTRVYFSLNKIDCNQGIWTPVYSNTFVNGVLIEKGPKEWTWNMIDPNTTASLSGEHVLRRLVCKNS